MRDRFIEDLIKLFEEFWQKPKGKGVSSYKARERENFIHVFFDVIEALAPKMPGIRLEQVGKPNGTDLRKMIASVVRKHGFDLSPHFVSEN